MFPHHAFHLSSKHEQSLIFICRASRPISRMPGGSSSSSSGSSSEASDSESSSSDNEDRTKENSVHTSPTVKRESSPQPQVICRDCGKCFVSQLLNIAYWKKCSPLTAVAGLVSRSVYGMLSLLHVVFLWGFFQPERGSLLFYKPTWVFQA